MSFLALCAVLSGCVMQPSLIPDASNGMMSGGWNAALGTNDLVRAMVNIEVEKSKSYHTTQATLLLKKPSYLRLEILSVMGISGLCVIAAPEKMIVYLPSKNEFYSGRPSRQNISKFIPLPLDAADIVPMLTGSIPGLTDDSVEKRLYQENDPWRLDMTWRSGVSQTAWLKLNRLIRLTRSGDGPQEWLNAEYFYENERESLPSKIVFTMADGGYIGITYTDLSVEKTDDVSMFNMDLPPNATVVDLN
ncbi:MAG TPA: DUF4292 domain-containing protein [Smithella sp.]|nr:DUF4292 domain-containing protein [Smithella sp.]